MDSGGHFNILKKEDISLFKAVQFVFQTSNMKYSIVTSIADFIDETIQANCVFVAHVSIHLSRG